MNHQDTIIILPNDARIELSAAQCKAIAHLVDKKNGITFTRQCTLTALVKRGIFEHPTYKDGIYTHTGYQLTALGYKIADMLGALEAFEDYANAIEDATQERAGNVSDLLAALSLSESDAIKRFITYGHNQFTHPYTCAALIIRGVFAPDALAAKFNDARFSALTALGYELAYQYGYLGAYSDYANELMVNFEFFSEIADSSSEFFAALGIESEDDNSSLPMPYDERIRIKRGAIWVYADNGEIVRSERALYAYTFRVFRNANTLERRADDLTNASIRAFQMGDLTLEARLQERAGMLYKKSVELTDSIAHFPARIISAASYSAFYNCTHSL